MIYTAKKICTRICEYNSSIYAIIIMYIINASSREGCAARVLVTDYCLHFGRLEGEGGSRGSALRENVINASPIYVYTHNSIRALRLWRRVCVGVRRRQSFVL